MNPESFPNQIENRPTPITADEANEICVRADKTRVGSREELMRRKDEFSHVFATAGNSTSNGSVYFVLSTGEVIRSKIMNGREVSVVFGHYLFVSKTDTERFNQYYAESKDDPLMHVPFVPISAPEVGGSVIDYSDENLFVDANVMRGLIVRSDGRPIELLMDDRLRGKGRHRSSPIGEIVV